MTFQSTLPREERRQTEKHNRYSADISIHAPTRGATHIVQCLPYACFYFNPRSHERSDQPQQSVQDNSLIISIHAPTRGATAYQPDNTAVTEISIHAPTRGATTRMGVPAKYIKFQSTLPREERPFTRSHCFVTT